MISLRTLGTVSLRDESGRELSRILEQPSQLAVLAYLAISGSNGYVQREKLLGMLWPEAEENRARASLRQVLHGLRRELGENVLVTRGDSNVGLSDESVLCDVREFEAAVEAGELRRAVAVYGGYFLDGFYIRYASGFESWIRSKRRQLERQFENTLEDLAVESEADGNMRAATEWWHRLVEHDPCNSRYALGLMQALQRTGDLGEALKVAAGYETAVRDELAAEPDPEVLKYLQQLRFARDRRA